MSTSKLADDSESILLLRSTLSPEDDGTDRLFAVPGAGSLGVRLSIRRGASGQAWLLSLSIVKPRTRVAPRLTPRERQVFELLVTGASNRQIALKVGLSPVTVGCNLSSIYRKFGVSGRSELLAVLLSNAINPRRKSDRLQVAPRRASFG